ncbi:membrane protein [Cocleimonas flava]|uniref:Pilus assembly protein n=1 Tax=Cocleimonas flava TaxID=634765 RepID=A0A4R1F2Q6_9GAMM|nr:hypothetical protein [Cocleimonas flava]TCJ86794.1 hypothetical protein EV695_1292 [Cocleimonas flava]
MKNAVNMNMKKQQLGQGMTEYIVIVALIAVAAIGAYGYFGKTVQHQVANLAAEVSGDHGAASTSAAAAKTTAGKAEEKAKQAVDMGTFGANTSTGGE